MLRSYGKLAILELLEQFTTVICKKLSLEVYSIIVKITMTTPTVDKIKKYRLIILTVLVTAVFSSFLTYILKPIEIKVPHPYTSELLRSNSFGCTSLIGSWITKGDGNTEPNDIKAELSRGTDKLALEIENDKLYFLTSTALNAGSARGDAFSILKNTDSQLVAVHNGLNGPSSDLNIITVNKKLGLGIWSKITPEYAFVNTPQVQSYYLECR